MRLSIYVNNKSLPRFESTFYNLAWHSFFHPLLEAGAPQHSMLICTVDVIKFRLQLKDDLVTKDLGSVQDM